MVEAEKLKEIETLWRTRDREVLWEGIDWKTGRYDGEDLRTLLQVPLIDVVEERIQEIGFFAWAYSSKEEASAWITWDYCLASFLFAWLHQPSESLSPLLWDEAAGLLVIPEPRMALGLAGLFEGPSSFTLGFEGLSEKLKCKEGLNEIHMLDGMDDCTALFTIPWLLASPVNKEQAI